MQLKPKQLGFRTLLILAMPLLLVAIGCQNGGPLNSSNSYGLFESKNEIQFATLLNSVYDEENNANTNAAQRLAVISGEVPAETDSSTAVVSQLASTTETSNQLIRTQSPDSGFGFPQGSASFNSSQAGYSAQTTQDKSSQQEQKQEQQQKQGSSTNGGTFNRDPNVQKTAYQSPGFNGAGLNQTPGGGLNPLNIGSPNQINPSIRPFENGGNASTPFPMNYADLDVYVAETQTGRINFGGAYNSDSGIVGQFIVDEKNFDITRWPRNFREIVDGTAWRGAGQNFRLELAPGANQERYSVSFTEPYLLGTDYSFSASAYLFERQYFDFDEKRVGGRFSLGRRLTQDLSISAGLRIERVNIDNPRLDTSAQLNANLGRSNLNLGNVGLVRDTRDSSYAATEGSYFAATYSQAFGDFSYARGDVDYRRYRLLYERPDGSGRHTVSFGTKLGFSGSSTPVFENYFAGGFSTLRGFDFRGAAPIENGVRVGGEFQWLNSVEYMFPITADDMIKGVLFCDFGTVEDGIELNSENFRVAPGFGFRVAMPGQGGAPLAFDFAFPVSTAVGDDEKVFSFYLGVLR